MRLMTWFRHFFSSLWWLRQWKVLHGPLPHSVYRQTFSFYSFTMPRLKQKFNKLQTFILKTLAILMFSAFLAHEFKCFFCFFFVSENMSLTSLKVVDSRPARSAGRVKKKDASNPLKMFVCVTKGLYYYLRSLKFDLFCLCTSSRSPNTRITQILRKYG